MDRRTLLKSATALIPLCIAGTGDHHLRNEILKIRQLFANELAKKLGGPVALIYPEGITSSGLDAEAREYLRRQVWLARQDPEFRIVVNHEARAEGDPELQSRIVSMPGATKDDLRRVGDLMEVFHEMRVEGIRFATWCMERMA